MSLSSPMPTPSDLGRLFLRRPLLWLVPMGICTVLALAYALLKPDSWLASQGLMIRNEAAGNAVGPGKFGHSDELKHLQEMLLEIAKNEAVLKRTLLKVGPPATRKESGTFPTLKEVEELMECVALSPPYGTEFGATEVFYLGVKDRDRNRALKLTAVLWEEMRARFAQIREAKAGSMIAELENSVSLAEVDVQQAIARLSVIEQEVGGDLAELRSLNEFSSGDGDLRQKTLALENELRQAEVAQKNAQELFELLVAAQEDPGRLVATPNRLLESQPALRRLKDGLVDSQLATSQRLGTMTEEHPTVQASMAAEQQISQHLYNELAIAIRGVQVEMRLTADQVARLNTELGATRGRLDRLARLRAEYSRLATDAEHRTTLLQKAQRELVDARASQAGAVAASLVTPIDEPTTGSRPLGPSKRIIVAGGALGGLLLGIGLVLLTATPTMPPPEPNSTELADETPSGEAPTIELPTTRPRLSVRAALGKQTRSG